MSYSKLDRKHFNTLEFNIMEFGAEDRTDSTKIQIKCQNTWIVADAPGWELKRAVNRQSGYRSGNS